MWFQMNLWDILNATSSPELASGLMLCAAPDGQTTGQFGQAVARANLSARQAKAAGLLTSGTSGHPSIISSESVSLQRSLASRLQASTASDGSTLYRLTWMHRATPAGRLLPMLVLSGLGTNGSGYIGLPTPSGTSNHGKNHVAGRMDEWGGSSNPFRGTPIGKLHCPSFEFWMMGIPAAWASLMRPAMLSTPRKRKRSSNQS